MRRLLKPGLIAIAILAVTAAIADAASEPILAGSGTADVFAAPSYAHPGGTVAIMQINGGSSPAHHSITTAAIGPDGKPLFRSATVYGVGNSTTVDGTQYLSPGTYPFFCGIHGPIMSSQLVVTGTPLRRPTVSLSVVSRKIKKVAKKGKLRVQVTTAGTSKADLVAKLGSQAIASATLTGLGPYSPPPPLILSKAARKKLRHKKKAKIVVTASIDFGSAATTVGTLKK